MSDRPIVVHETGWPFQQGWVHRFVAGVRNGTADQVHSLLNSGGFATDLTIWTGTPAVGDWPAEQPYPALPGEIVIRGQGTWLLPSLFSQLSAGSDGPQMVISQAWLHGDGPVQAQVRELLNRLALERQILAGASSLNQVQQALGALDDAVHAASQVLPATVPAPQAAQQIDHDAQTLAGLASVSQQIAGGQSMSRASDYAKQLAALVGQWPGPPPGTQAPPQPQPAVPLPSPSPGFPQLPPPTVPPPSAVKDVPLKMQPDGYHLIQGGSYRITADIVGPATTQELAQAMIKAGFKSVDGVWFDDDAGLPSPWPTAMVLNPPVGTRQFYGQGVWGHGNLRNFAVDPSRPVTVLAAWQHGPITSKWTPSLPGPPSVTPPQPPPPQPVSSSGDSGPMGVLGLAALVLGIVIFKRA